jgi:DNA polymerase-1
VKDVLKGYIKYTHEFINNAGSVEQHQYHYNVYGIDTIGSINLTLQNPIASAMQFLDPENEGLAYTEKRVQIKGTCIMVESERNPIGKRYRPNVDFFARLGLLFSHIKKNCVNKNSVFELDLGEFDARISTDYEVQFGEYLAKVTLAYSRLSRLSFKGYGFEIELKEEEKKGYEPAYQTTTENVKIGYKKTDLYDLFGIEQKKEVILDFNNINEESAFYANIDEIIEAHPDKDFKWLLGRNYQIVTDETLEQTIEYLKGFDLLAVDTETTGLTINFKSRTGEADECVGVILTGKEGESFYFPMKHTKFENVCGGDDWYFMEHYMKPLLENKKLVAHNASFDWRVIYIYGIAPNIVFDTMVAFALTLQAKYGTGVSLKYLTSLILKRDSLELDDLCRSGDFSTVDETFADLPKELVRLYACADADNTLALYNYIMKTKMLEEYNAVKVTQFESLFACVIGYSQFHGQFTDVRKTDELVTLIERDQQSAMDEMKKILIQAGYDPSNFNPNSAPQKMHILYEVLGYPEQTNLEGKRTSDKKALKRLAEMTNENDEPLYPFAVALLRYNEAETLRKNFTKNLPTLCTPDGFMFSDVDQFKATGRVSTKDPNYQGYNNTVKKYIIPRPGYYMCDSDYSSIEYRVIASMSGQESLIEAFKDPNTDYHKLQASNMFEVPYELVTKEMRKEAKAFNFGLPFGMGDAKLGLTLFGSVSAENTKKAALYRRKYFKNQEKVEKFFINAQNDAVKYGYTETFFHRRRYYNKETTSIGSIKRQGGNQRIQGTAADIYKQAAVRLFLRVINEGWLDKVLFTGFIHDELLTEVSKEIHPLEWLKVLKEETELKIEGFCPIYIGCGFGRSWYEAKSVELPVELQNEIMGKIEEFPNWDGNIDDFAKWIPKRIDRFQMDYVDRFITDTKNQGQVISSVTFDYLTEQVTRMQNEYLEEVFKGVSDGQTLELDHVTYSILVSLTNKAFSKSHHKPTLSERALTFCKKNKIALNNVTVVADESQEPLDFHNLQVLLDYYCQQRGIDRSQVNLLSPSDVEVNTNNINSDVIQDPETYRSYYEQEMDEEKAKQIFIAKMKDYGSHLDVDSRIAYFRYDKGVMGVLQKYVNKSNEGYSVAFYDINEDKRYVTKSFITSDKLRLVQRELIMVGV